MRRKMLPLSPLKITLSRITSILKDRPKVIWCHPEYYQVYMTKTGSVSEYEFTLTLHYGKQVCLVGEGDPMGPSCDRTAMIDEHACGMSLRTRGKVPEVTHSVCHLVIE